VRILAMCLGLMSASPAFAGTAMVIARQPTAPVQLVKTLHGIPDLLQSAEFENRSGKSITSYRVGWAYITAGKSRFMTGPWMNVPTGIKPGLTETVPAQGVKLDKEATEIVFFISDVKFSDGGDWKAKHNELKETRPAK